MVALDTVMLIGADQVVQHKEVVPAIEGTKVLGAAGLVIVTPAILVSSLFMKT